MAPQKFTVESSMIRLFAQALGDTNPVYYEESAAGTDAGGVIAPPTFIQASAHWDPDYPLRWQPGRPWNGSGPTEGRRVERTGGGTGLHAEQHYDYHRPVRPGDVLTPTIQPGSSWTKEGRRGGTMRFQESITQWHDDAGELVLTVRSVGVTTGRVVSSEGDS
ncbi:MAG: FAS1-like dehydratase domain-containing protein [Streptosporangiaceae bacterium]